VAFAAHMQRRLAEPDAAEAGRAIGIDQTGDLGAFVRGRARVVRIGSRAIGVGFAGRASVGCRGATERKLAGARVFAQPVLIPEAATDHDFVVARVPRFVIQAKLRLQLIAAARGDRLGIANRMVLCGAAARTSVRIERATARGPCAECCAVVGTGVARAQLLAGLSVCWKGP
jgi:hypothetical protein